MKLDLKNGLRILFGIYPEWTKRRDPCHSCRMSFGTAKNHYEYVMREMDKKHGVCKYGK